MGIVVPRPEDKTTAHGASFISPFPVANYIRNFLTTKKKSGAGTLGNHFAISVYKVEVGLRWGGGRVEFSFAPLIALAKISAIDWICCSTWG